MGLIKCPKCEKEIRKGVENCPYCGGEIAHAKNGFKSIFPYILAVIIAIILFGMFKTYLNYQSERSSKDVMQGAIQDVEKDIREITESSKKQIEEIADTAKKQTEEPGVIKTKDYAIDEDNYINFTLKNSDDGPVFMVYININDSEKVSLAFAQYYSYLSKDEMEEYNPSICAIYNDLMMIWTCSGGSANIAATNSDGSYVHSLPDWIISDINDFTMSEDEQAEFVKDVTGFVSDFIE